MLRANIIEDGEPAESNVTEREIERKKSECLASVDTESRQHTRMRKNAQEIVKTIWTSDALADRCGAENREDQETRAREGPRRSLRG